MSQLLEDPRADASKWQNVVAFGEGNQLIIEAVLEGVRDEKSFFYRFSGGFFRLKGACSRAVSTVRSFCRALDDCRQQSDESRAGSL